AKHPTTQRRQLLLQSGKVQAQLLGVATLKLVELLLRLGDHARHLLVFGFQKLGRSTQRHDVIDVVDRHPAGTTYQIRINTWPTFFPETSRADRSCATVVG